MKINIIPSTALRYLLIVIAFLVFANTMGVIPTVFLDSTIMGLVPLFCLDMEQNIPTLFQSGQLVLCSMLLFMAASIHQRLGKNYLYWIVLSGIFLFLAIDEVSSLHENMIGPLRRALNTSGPLYWAWVIPYGGAAAFLTLAYYRFLKRLPKRTMMLFIVSGALFILGTIGFEMLGSGLAEQYGGNFDRLYKSLLYTFYYTCEETCEMVGIALFIYALLDYMAKEFNHVSVTVLDAV
jgi:hypothetical protein